MDVLVKPIFQFLRHVVDVLATYADRLYTPEALIIHIVQNISFKPFCFDHHSNVENESQHTAMNGGIERRDESKNAS